MIEKRVKTTCKALNLKPLHKIDTMTAPRSSHGIDADHGIIAELCHEKPSLDRANHCQKK